MGSYFPEITEQQAGLIRMSAVFFVATAEPGGSINLSPKGGVPLYILNPNRVAFLTMTSCGYGVPVMNFVLDRRVADRGRRYKQL